MEPDPACAAELGQLFSDALPDCSFELAQVPAADLVLMDQVLLDKTATEEGSIDNPSPAPSSGPAIVFTRSSNGMYRTQTLQAPGIAGLETVTFSMPLTDSIRCAFLLQTSRHKQSPQAESSEILSPTQSQRLQDRLSQIQRMEAVGELASGIANDFNNLLLVIRSCAERLLEEPDLPTVRHYTREILNASQRASGLTRELLTFSRRQPQQLLPTNLNSIVESAVPMLSRLVGKNIVVWVKLPPDLWPIQANTEQLEQVLVNLAANARDAMPRAGKLLLETSNVLIEDKHAAMPPGDYVMLAVSDTGLGIPQHVPPRIFEPFFTTKERGKGTGLGLASVYGIVKQSGGYVWAYSESGYGTTFKIYLPRAAAAKKPPEEFTTLLSARAASSSGSA